MRAASAVALLLAANVLGCNAVPTVEVVERYQGELKVTSVGPIDGLGDAYDAVTMSVPTIVRKTSSGFVFEDDGACDGLLFTTQGDSASIDVDVECANHPSFFSIEGAIADRTDGTLGIYARLSNLRDKASTISIEGTATRVTK